jgi:carbonic anhydrase/acetyltransferase-like protein (isoleucine patch superfamily)
MRFIIIGGGGLGIELYTYISSDIQSGRLPNHCTIGVLNDTVDCELMNRIPEANYLGCEQEFVPSEGDRALIAIGDAAVRRKVYRLTQERAIQLGTYIHPSAWVAHNATIGKGVIVFPNCVVSAFAEVSDNVAVNVFCGLGHGAKVGEHSVMCPYSVINGDASLGESGFLGTRATLFPKVVLGKGCMVDAHTAVKASEGNYKIISFKGQYLVLDNRLAMRDLAETL